MFNSTTVPLLVALLAATNTNPTHFEVSRETLPKQIAEPVKAIFDPHYNLSVALPVIHITASELSMDAGTKSVMSQFVYCVKAGFLAEVMSELILTSKEMLTPTVLVRLAFKKGFGTLANDAQMRVFTPPATKLLKNRSKIESHGGSFETGKANALSCLRKYNLESREGRLTDPVIYVHPTRRPD